MRTVAAMAAAMAAAALGWSMGAEAAEARIEGFAFACTTPEGETLKPKFGDVGGVLYSDIPAQREQCLEAIERRIALCRENVDFESDAKKREHAPCLPIFAETAEDCVGHFESERVKCGSAPVGKGEAARQAVDAKPEDVYTVAPLDTAMEVTARANLRSGPGTDYAVLGTLNEGVGVRVTGTVEDQGWLRVDLLLDGGAAFIHDSLLREVAAPAPEAPEAPLEPFGPEWSIVANQPCQVWNWGSRVNEPFTWSGACLDGKASGAGILVCCDGEFTFEGAMQAGKLNGHGTETWPDGRYEGGFRDGERHGFGTLALSNGSRYEGEWRGDWYPTVGRATIMLDHGARYEGEYRDGKPHGHGTVTTADDRVYEGQWREGCFGERDGDWAHVHTTAEACGFE